MCVCACARACVCACVSVYEWVWEFTNPCALAGCDTTLIFKWSLTGLSSEFSFSETGCLYEGKKTNPVSVSILFIVGVLIIRSIPFPRVLGVCEIRTASSRFWTRFAVSISNDDKLYTNYVWVSSLWQCVNARVCLCVCITIEQPFLSKRHMNIYTISRLLYS